MPWLPTAFLDSRYVRWAAVDDHRASATLQVNDVTATGLFEFGSDELPSTFSAERFFDAGDGKSVMTPFVGRFTDYRPVEGVLVPHRAVAAWIVEGTSHEYVRFDVERLEFDVH
jgi:hypothetical protein